MDEDRLDVVHTGEERDLKIFPATHNVVVRPIGDGTLFLRVQPKDEAIPPGSQVVPLGDDGLV